MLEKIFTKIVIPILIGCLLFSYKNFWYSFGGLISSMVVLLSMPIAIILLAWGGFNLFKMIKAVNTITLPSCTENAMHDNFNAKSTCANSN